MAARSSIRLGPLIGALLLPVVPGLAGGATDARVDYVRAHGAAALADVSANNPFADEKGLDRVAIEALWKKEGERMADFVKASSWTPILGWAARCEGAPER